MGGAERGAGMTDEDFKPAVGARGVSFENRIAITALVTAVVVLVPMASVLFVLEQWRAGRSPRP